MPSAAKMLLVILSIPLLVAVGHDIYINYFSSDERIREVKNLQIDPEAFMMSDLGWVWQQYSPSTMEAARDMTPPETWKGDIDPILQLSSIVAAAAPPVLGIVFLAITFLIGIWPFSRFGNQQKADKKGYGVYDKAKTHQVKYKR